MQISSKDLKNKAKKIKEEEEEVLTKKNKKLQYYLEITPGCFILEEEPEFLIGELIDFKDPKDLFFQLYNNVKVVGSVSYNSDISCWDFSKPFLIIKDNAKIEPTKKNQPVLYRTQELRELLPLFKKLKNRKKIKEHLETLNFICI